MNPIISIVVPIYNVEKYLPQCIDSILNQSFKDFELILVDDGSTDNCLKICEDYKKLDKRVIVIHKENGGLSSARNAGIKVSRGKYIAFIDSDDFIHKDMYKVLYNNLKNNNLDISICNYTRVNENSLLNDNESNKLSKISKYNNIEALNELYTDNRLIFTVVWNKLYRRDIFENIVFDYGKSDEDEFIIHKILYKGLNIGYVDKDLYFYRIREDSITGSVFNIKRLDKLEALSNRIKFFKDIDQVELYDKAVKNFIDAFFWNYIKAKNELDNIDTKLYEIKLLYNELFIDMLRCKLISWKFKLIIILFRLNPKSYLKLFN